MVSFGDVSQALQPELQLLGPQRLAARASAGAAGAAGVACHAAQLGAGRGDLQVGGGCHIFPGGRLLGENQVLALHIIVGWPDFKPIHPYLYP